MFHMLQRAYGFGLQKLTGVGQFDPTAGANQQRAAQLGFKGFYLHAQCGLNNVEPLCGPAKVPFFCDSQKVFQVA
jgi:hypothetical protein